MTAHGEWLIKDKFKKRVGINPCYKASKQGHKTTSNMFSALVVWTCINPSLI